MKAKHLRYAGPALADLRTKSGRRQAIDPILFTKLEAMQGRIYGSSGTIAQVMAGRRTGADQRLLFHVNSFYLKGIQEALRGTEALCLNWDPGSYSGYQWVLGIFYSVADNISGVIPPKVPRDSPPISGRGCSEEFFASVTGARCRGFGGPQGPR